MTADLNISKLETSSKHVHLNKDPQLSGANKIPLGNRINIHLLSELEKLKKSKLQNSPETKQNTAKLPTINLTKHLGMNIPTPDQAKKNCSSIEQKKTYSEKFSEDELELTNKKNRNEECPQSSSHSIRTPWNQMDSVRKRLESLEIQEMEDKMWNSLKGDFLFALATGNLHTIMDAMEDLPDEVLAKINKSCTWDPG
jgi:hypothetical protein